MSFDNDPFENIVNQFFGQSARVRRPRARRALEEDSQNTQFIEEGDYVYMIIEIPGYTEKEVSVIVKDSTIFISAKASQKMEAQDYIEQKRRQGLTLEETLPGNVKTKNFTKTFRNGILEVIFEAK